MTDKYHEMIYHYAVLVDTGILTLREAADEIINERGLQNTEKRQEQIMNRISQSMEKNSTYLL